MEVIPHGPQHQRRARYIFTIFKIIPFFCFVLFCFFLFSFFSNFFLIVKSSIYPLIFIPITYYYYLKKKKTFFFFKANTIYSLWMVVGGFLFVCLFFVVVF